MYRICPPAVFAHESVMANSTYRARVERVVAALEEPRDIITYTDADLPRMIQDEGLLANRKSMGMLDEVRDPILLFNTFRFDEPESARARKAALEAAGIKGLHEPFLQSRSGRTIFTFNDPDGVGLQLAREDGHGEYEDFT